jgi:Flp pilus assembly protein TadG
MNATATTRYLSRLTHRLKRDSNGAAAVEFAFVSIILVMMLIVTTDLSLGFFSYTQVQSAAQTGAQYAAVYGYDSTKISTAVTSATSASGLTATPAPTTFCGCAGTAGVTTTACNATCPDTSGAGTYVTVSAARTYTPLIHYPGFPDTYAQTATSTVRIK